MERGNRARAVRPTTCGNRCAASQIDDLRRILAMLGEPCWIRTSDPQLKRRSGCLKSKVFWPLDGLSWTQSRFRGGEVDAIWTLRTYALSRNHGSAFPIMDALLDAPSVTIGDDSSAT